MKIKFYKVIIFSDNPLTTQFRFEDKFQIYPYASPNAPQSDKIKLYPIALEYWVDEDVDVEVPELFEGIEGFYLQTVTSMLPQTKILSLLTSLSNYRFYVPQIKWQWFCEIFGDEDKEKMNNQKSVAGLNTYWYPESFKERQIEDFSTVDFPLISFKSHPDYFRNITLDENEEIVFPEHISIALHNYYALPEQIKPVIEATSSLINNGIALRGSMNSLSYISFISSIETLVDFEFKNEEVKKCECCGTTQYRVMGKFRNFIFKYVSTAPETKKQLNEIYNLRSKIAHAGELLLADNIFSWGNDKIRGEQWQIHLSAMQLCRVALTNWLLMTAKNESIVQEKK
ncbi:MAG: HEPN domain-containing protein [Niabella sp.]